MFLSMFEIDNTPTIPRVRFKTCGRSYWKKSVLHVPVLLPSVSFGRLRQTLGRRIAPGEISRLDSPA
jgi:hypothetical protein